MNNKNQSFQKDYNFLHDEAFIKWRLLQTKESEKYWSDFLADNPQFDEDIKKAILQFNAVKINRNQLPEDDKRDIYKTILYHIHRYKRRRLLRKVSSVAAVLVIGILSVLFIIHQKDNAPHQTNEIIVGQTLPEEEIYLVSDGKKMNIAHKSHIGLTEDGRALVTDTTDSKKELILGKTELNKLVVPYGKRSNLTLPDGTEVWLNSGTQLDFPSEFTGKTREIHVNGEIFIDVAKNRHIPFIVHAGDMSVHVYGTSFNVSAYNDDNKKIVVLVEGRVRIETAGMYTDELSPNEKIEVAGDDITSKVKVDVSEYISWTKGVLEFNETPMDEILKKIGRYYNVQFKRNPDIELNDKTCSGKLFLSNNLDSVMTSVSVLSSTVYQRENNIIHITKK